MIIGGYVVNESETPGKILIFNALHEGGEFSEEAFMRALENGQDDLPTTMDTFFWENF